MFMELEGCDALETGCCIRQKKLSASFVVTTSQVQIMEDEYMYKSSHSEDYLWFPESLSAVLAEIKPLISSSQMIHINGKFLGEGKTRPGT